MTSTISQCQMLKEPIRVPFEKLKPSVGVVHLVAAEIVHHGD